MLFRLATIVALLAAMVSPRTATDGPADQATRTLQSRGPSGVPPRRVSRYHDPLVEPSTFEQPADAKPLLPEHKPLLPEDWKPEEANPTAEALAGDASTKPPSRRRLGSSSTPAPSTRPRLTGLLDEMTSWRAPQGSVTTAASGLALVIGLVMISAWVAKKSLPRSAQPLPSDAAEVLGRLRLNGKQTAQLVRLGRKLVLIHVTPTGAETITELTDEADVERVLAACDRGRGGSTAEFEEVLDRMGAEPTAPGFLDEPTGFDPRRLADAYANTPGGRAHG